MLVFNLKPPPSHFKKIVFFLLVVSVILALLWSQYRAPVPLKDPPLLPKEENFKSSVILFLSELPQYLNDEITLHDLDWESHHLLVQGAAMSFQKVQEAVNQLKNIKAIDQIHMIEQYAVAEHQIEFDLSIQLKYFDISAVSANFMGWEEYGLQLLEEHSLKEGGQSWKVQGDYFSILNSLVDLSQSSFFEFERLHLSAYEHIIIAQISALQLSEMHKQAGT